MFLARLNGEGGKIFLEVDEADVVRNMVRMDDGEDLKLEYWHINDGPNLSLDTVTLKSGTRTKGVVTEVAEIEAGGEDVGSVEVEA